MSPSSPAGTQFLGPRGDVLVGGQGLGRGQLAAHQRRVPGVLQPPLHPRVLRRGLPPFLRLLRGGLDDGAGDRGAQPGRGQPGRPVQHLRLGGPGLLVLQQHGGPGDDLRLVPGDRPVFQPRLGAGQAAGQGLRHADQAVGPRAGLPQRVRDLVTGELLVQLPGVPPGQLGDGGELAGVRVGLDPVPPAHHPDQLSLRDTGEPAVLPRSGVGGDRQLRASWQHVQGHARAERCRRAGRLTGEGPRGAGLTRTPPARAGRLGGEQLIGGRLADLGELLRGERGEVVPRLRPRRGPRPARTAGPAMPRTPRPSSGRGPARRDPRPTQGPRKPVPEA